MLPYYVGTVLERQVESNELGNFVRAAFYASIKAR